MTDQSLQKIDHNAIKYNQITVILLNILAFIIDLPWLTGIVALIMLLGVLRGKPGFNFLYHFILIPTGLTNPVVLMDNNEPHRFAQLLGGLFTALGTILLFLDFTIAGWFLVWLVAFLAALNAFGGFCVGCAIYYWLNRLRIPGFTKSPPDGSVPGRKPQK